MRQPSLPPLVEVRGLAVRRGEPAVRQGEMFALAVDSLDIYSGETLAVIGPNGAGKSTLLLSLAHLLKPQAGTIRFRGHSLEDMDDLAYRRRIALVLQEPLLLDRRVFDNVAAPLRFRGLPRELIRQRAHTWLERLGIGNLHDRGARQLSGGEAQRLSLARALALEPELLLLDEPFSALDAPTRQRLLDDLRLLLSESSITAIFVTHDQNEALILGDRVAVVLEGRLRQVGTPSQVFGAPIDETVAAFVGVETVLPGGVFSVKDGQVMVLAHGVPIYAVGQMTAGQRVLACLRPEDITLWRGGELPSSSARNRLPGEVVRLSPLGPLVRVEVTCGREPSLAAGLINLVALVTRHSAEEMALAPGVEVTATFKASAVHLIAR